MAKVNKTYEIWFLTGSQNLYGEETLKQVAEQSKQVLEALKKNVSAPVELGRVLDTAIRMAMPQIRQTAEVVRDLADLPLVMGN